MVLFYGHENIAHSVISPGRKGLPRREMYIYIYIYISFRINVEQLFEF